MRDWILRFVIIVTIITLVTGSLVTGYGLIKKWTTAVQFSNGFFFGGVLLMGIGFVNVLGMLYQETNTDRQNNQAVEVDKEERFKLWTADTAKGYNKLAYFGTAGLVLFGMSFLLLKL
jgi:hypothetical protein